MKLYFLHELNARAEVELLRQQVAIREAYRRRLAQRVAIPDGFLRLVAQSKQSAAEATAEWLRSYAWELEQESLTTTGKKK